uniref:CCHC-type domain-containing protein n=1 Tax=Arundo donax TaxID=35708 RepID=A0A0A9CFM3_ARUDO
MSDDTSVGSVSGALIDGVALHQGAGRARRLPPVEGVAAPPRPHPWRRRVLFEDLPTGGADDVAAAKKWAHDDAVCPGHILAALSDCMLPEYARHATAADLWRAPTTWRRPASGGGGFNEFCFDEDGPFLEQLAHAEALGAAAELGDGAVAFGLREKLPEVVGMAVLLSPDPKKEGMELVWDVARRVVSNGAKPEFLWARTATGEDPEDCYVDDLKPEQNTVCWSCGEPGHIVRNCGEPGRVAKKFKRRA